MEIKIQNGIWFAKKYDIVVHYSYRKTWLDLNIKPPTDVKLS